MAKYPRSAATGTSMRERCADRDEDETTMKTAEELEEKERRRRDEARTGPTTMKKKAAELEKKGQGNETERVRDRPR